MTKDRERYMRKIILGAAAMIALATTSTANAHDFFLMPDQFRTPTADPVKIQVTVGSNFNPQQSASTSPFSFTS